jgi:hypothetical protein
MRLNLRATEAEGSSPAPAISARGVSAEEIHRAVEPAGGSLAPMPARDAAPAAAVALRVAVFVSGAVLLGVEIVASRVLAPSFGSSLFVWGSLIGVVLTGLAVGYWVGGALSGRTTSPYLLTSVLALGAGLVLLVPVVDGSVISAVVAWDPGARLNPLLAATALFAPLSIVLAAATPIAVRLAVLALEQDGRTAGRLFSI